MAQFCKKHAKVPLEIGQGKRNQNFVFCPECRPDLAKPGSAKPAEPVPAPIGKKPNEQTGKIAWYDRPLF